MISENLQKAIDGLRIVDVYVREIFTNCHEDFDPKRSSLDDLILETKHLVKDSEQKSVIHIENPLFCVHLEMGARWVVDSSSRENKEVKAFIEADFIAEYEIITSLNQESLDEFASINAGYDVWPYWRELLASQCDRMRLPRVMLPTVQFLKE